MRIVNRRAFFNYYIIDRFEAGIVLSGAEVKSVRLSRADLSVGFARVVNGSVILKNVYIPPYHGARKDYDPRSDRKLLLHKAQIRSLTNKLSKKGTALVPLAFYTTRNLIKVELGIGIAKKEYDKRRSIKAKDEKRKIEQDLD